MEDARQLYIRVKHMLLYTNTIKYDKHEYSICMDTIGRLLEQLNHACGTITGHDDEFAIIDRNLALLLDKIMDDDK